MKIDKELCNKILIALSKDYPSRMSSSSFEHVAEGIEDGDHLAAQFKHLENQGYLDTKLIPIDNANGSTTQQVQLALTIITHEGLDIVTEGGIK
ncbi:hypothetical protein [Pantoea agglomerans]|uniref:hypothetical protein n=1 Tax=Enterobacter agglomerans TaxID=549 RepID=UPI003C7C7915